MQSSLAQAQPKPKALPPVTKGDDLPPPPPSPLHPLDDQSPLPPSKSLVQSQRDSSSTSFINHERSAERSPHFHATLSPPAVASPPGSPFFPSASSASGGPPSSGLLSGSESRPKKVNPFVDLLETEKIYIDTLSGIIRKVAAAWSRSNLPPPELDIMFRSLEAIYKANRSFQTKLKEIGSNPSSPRAIGDLLMKWIDQLDSPYSKYASSYLTGFDTWEPVQSNQRLFPILEAFAESNPPPHAATWTLDELLSLPRLRIKYYLKLYGRLLKNSTPGKSTDQKLIEGVGKMENLLATTEKRSNVALPGSSQAPETTDEIVIDTRSNAEDNQKSHPPSDEGTERSRSDDTLRLREGLDVRNSTESSFRSSSLSSGLRSSRDTSMTSEGRASVMTLSMSLADLERRLATERCQDLFTMTPRNVKLSINSPNLPYTREIRLSEDTVIHFTPKCNNTEVVHRQGHIFLLTDLFLICERMSFEDRARFDAEGIDMWLCYPPLAAKHLRIALFEDTAIEVTILKKETMLLYFDSSTKRDTIFKEFRSIIELAASLPLPSNKPPPPLPTSNNLPSSEYISSARRPSDPPSGSFSPPRSGNASPRPASPASGAIRRDSSNNAPRYPMGNEVGPPPYSPASESARPPPQMASPLGPRPIDTPGSFVPPPRGESAREPMSPNARGMGLPSRPDMRDGSLPAPPSIGLGQVFQPQRSDSTRTLPPNGGMPPPRGAMSPPPMNNMRGPPRNMMSPPPMNGMAGGPPYMGPGPGPSSNGPMTANHPRMGGPGPGPGPGAIFTGPGPVHGPQSAGPFPNHPQQFPPPNQPFAHPGRPSSDPSYQGGVRKTPSLHSVHSQYEQQYPQQHPRSAPPVPNMPNDFRQGRQNSFGNPGSGFGPGPGPGQNHLRPMLPSAALPRVASSGPAFGLDDSPPPSPTERVPKGPVESIILASMKCKVFLQQQHAQWKALGSSKLTLYEQRPTMVKQLVVEADNRDKTILISTIVLTDGVERVGKTGVAIELSDNGARTGIVYMIQLRNEKSAEGLYQSLLSGSDRGGFRG